MVREECEVVVRPWGKYENIFVDSEYKVKIITVNPGHRLSLQRHRWRDEHWFIISGAGAMSIRNDSLTIFSVHPGQSINIKKGEWHRIQNPNQVPLVFVEIQTGTCFEEDIDREEDDYGRA